MKKILIGFLLTALYFMSHPSYSMAFETFTPSVHNPITMEQTIPEWTENNQMQSSVIKVNDTFVMFYSGRGSSGSRVVKATSTDGITWKQDSISNLPDKTTTDPFLLKLADKYALYYVSWQESPLMKIRKAYTNDLNNFTDVKDSILPDQGDESLEVSCPSALYSNGTTYLYYCYRNQRGNWVTNLAISTDGEHFNKCPTSLFDDDKHNLLYFENNKFYLFTTYSDHIIVEESNTPPGCNTEWNNPQTILTIDDSSSQILHAQAIVATDSKYYLYYMSLTNGNYRINVATSPRPQKPAVVLVPGLLASWSKEALLHNKTVSQSDWKLPAFITDYDGIIKSFENIGYKKNKDFFVYSYDWRKAVEDNATDLNSYLSEHIWKTDPERKIYLVGHSLGGLVSRVWAQNNPPSLLQKLVTIGTPHEGASEVYKMWEGGELDRDNTLWWLGEKIILTLNKTSFENDQQTFRKKMPVLLDLFPTYDFLKKEDQTIIAHEKMTEQNTLLPRYDTTFSTLFPNLATIYGAKKTTLAGFVVKPPTDEEKKNGIYLDGHPVSSYTEDGDGVVLSQSANQNSGTEKSSYHGELVSKKENIKQLFQTLSIPIDDAQIAEGKDTQISPALIFMIQSPATMEVLFNDKSFNEDDGIIYIPAAQTGTYQLKVKGTDLGKYTITVGQISEQNDVWDTITGEITKLPATSQTDSYSVDFDSTISHSIYRSSPSPTPTPTPTNSPTPTSVSATSTPTPTAAPNTTIQNIVNVLPTPVFRMSSPKYYSSSLPSVDKDLGTILTSTGTDSKEKQVLGAQREGSKKKDVSIFPVVVLIFILGFGAIVIIRYRTAIKRFMDKVSPTVL
ncbi:hypothetical protein HGA88_03610 [Candidatus Roizmanbacteria bacterium]|nr:hypothetical protein [Candidatus Roizmanbacteria bacterium]